MVDIGFTIINGTIYKLDDPKIMFITCDGYPLYYNSNDNSWSNDDFGFESNDRGFPFDFYCFNEPLDGKFVLKEEYKKGK